MHERLDGKVAVVTGGSKGIGRAVAHRLATEGADCVIAARDQDALAAAAGSIAEGTGRRVETVSEDLRTADGCEALHAAVTGVFDHVDILVNCAGATKPGGLLDVDDATWEDGFALKFFGAVRLCRLFWPQLTASHGVVVNVIGGLARTPAPDILVGGAVNAALANFTKALAGQGLRDDVNVNAVHPGQTMTDRLDMLLAKRAEAAGVSKEEFLAETTSRQGVRRLGRPEDVASVVAYLCSPEARHVQGVSLSVDGGGTSGLF